MPIEVPQPTDRTLDPLHPILERKRVQLLEALCTRLSAILDGNVLSLSGDIVTDCLCTFN